LDINRIHTNEFTTTNFSCNKRLEEQKKTFWSRHKDVLVCIPNEFKSSGDCLLAFSKASRPAEFYG